MKSMKALLALALLTLSLSAAQGAHAEPAGPAWGCQLDVNLEGHEVGFFVAHKVLEGEGTMSCRSVTGDVLNTFPIAMHVEGLGGGFGWSELRNQRFLTGSIGVTDPGFLYGKFSGQINGDVTVMDVNGTAGIGLDFSVKHDNVRGVAVKGVLSGGDANGLFAGLLVVKVDIRPLQR